MTSTYFLAQLIGLFLLAVGAAVLFRKAVFLEALSAVTKNGSALFFAGILLLVAGLCVVLGHNIWNAGFLPLLITLIGWILILRGLLSMFVPSDVIVHVIRWFKVEEFTRLYAILVLVIGAYLTWSGFTG